MGQPKWKHMPATGGECNLVANKCAAVGRQVQQVAIQKSLHEVVLLHAMLRGRTTSHGQWVKDDQSTKDRRDTCSKVTPGQCDAANYPMCAFAVKHICYDAAA